MTATEQIFEQIKKELAEGTVPWHKPWVSCPSMIISRDSGKPYEGLRNRMLLGRAGEYATIHQVNKDGGRVNKGAHGYGIYFARTYQKKSDDSEEERVHHVLKRFTVFHVLDTNLEPKYREIWEGTPPAECDGNRVIEEYASRASLLVQWGGDSAHYHPGHDYIIVPSCVDFSKDSEFWGTVFHELGHSTMKTLKRDYSYAKEELVAEICSCLCLGKLGMTPNIKNSSAYIESWSKRIKDFSSTDFSDACRSAEQAFNLIFNITPSKDN